MKKIIKLFCAASILTFMAGAAQAEGAGGSGGPSLHNANPILAALSHLGTKAH